MSAPNKIRVHGQIYVKVAAHKKCKPGSHWNEKSKKCMKLPDALNFFVNEASKYSSKAHKQTAKAKNSRAKDDHAAAASAHKLALQNHRRVMDVAERHGFADLAEEHRNRYNEHATLHNQHAVAGDVRKK